MKVAILHYWLVTRRGGEKVVENILKIFPQADIYTLFYDERSYGKQLENKIYTSKLNTPFLRKYYQKIFPLYPTGVRSIKLHEDYDIIISSESGPIKGVKIPKNALHVCYIHSPMRYCWGFTNEYLETIPYYLRPIASYFFRQLKEWDKTTVSNVDYYIANSYNVANRVKKYYNRDSHVIHPPISLNHFNYRIERNYDKEYYLSFGAITPYKRIDLLVKEFNQSGKQLIVIGEGSEKNKLIKNAKSNIQFKGAISWDEIREILQNVRALLFPGEEDFGMIPLEIMAYGIPVIAFNKGGALETVIENKECIDKSTGIFFNEQSTDSLGKAINYFESISDQFDFEFIRNHAREFGEDKFLHKLKVYINSLIKTT